MFGLGGPRRPTAVAFDIIGTVFPLESLRPSILALGMPPAGLEGWFAAGCRDAFAMAAAGDFRPFEEVLEGALDQMLAEQRLDPGSSERKAVIKGLGTLEARADAQSAFEALAAAEISVVALSNGAASSTRSLFKQAGLDALVDHVVSVEEVKLAKPHAEVYLHAAARAGVEPKELALVAAHPWDIHGGAAAGLTTAYLGAELPYSKALRKPDCQGGTLLELARTLAGL